MRSTLSLFATLLLMACGSTPQSTTTNDADRAYLRSLRTQEEFIREHHVSDLAPLIDGFRSGRFPELFAPLLRGKRQNILGLQAYTEQDPSFQNGRTALRAYIKNALALRGHQQRRGADYSEDISNIDNIEDVHMLVLLKQYVDFFSKDGAAEQFPKLFSTTDGGEVGGLVLWSKDGLRLVPIRSFNNDEDRVRLSVGMEYFYRIPQLVYHVPNIGLFHTHPIEPGVDPRERAGPSCSCLNGERLPQEADDVDTTVAKILARTNPHFMHIVITDLGESTYNVDAYFFDLHARAVGDAESGSEVVVIDLGVFRLPAKK